MDWNTTVEWLMTSPYYHLTHAQYLVIAAVCVACTITVWRVTRTPKPAPAECRTLSEDEADNKYMQLFVMSILFFLIIGTGFVAYELNRSSAPKPEATIQAETELVKQQRLLLEERQKCMAQLLPSVVKPDLSTFAQNNLVTTVRQTCGI